VAPVLDAFARKHPGVTVTLDLSDFPGARLVDTCDVVIHIGAPASLSEIVTTLAPNRRILCASPDYLASAPPIQSPADLVRHRCLVVRENDEDVTLWRFTSSSGAVTQTRIEPRLASNDGDVVRDWAVAGLGIIVRSEWSVADDLREGRLVRLLPDYRLPPANVIAFVGPRRGRTARTSRFVAFLKEALQPPPSSGSAASSSATARTCSRPNSVACCTRCRSARRRTAVSRPVSTVLSCFLPAKKTFAKSCFSR
jgi:DNA-binding transcriptional LysR family regulator